MLQTRRIFVPGSPRITQFYCDVNSLACLFFRILYATRLLFIRIFYRSALPSSRHSFVSSFFLLENKIKKLTAKKSEWQRKETEINNKWTQKLWNNSSNKCNHYYQDILRVLFLLPRPFLFAKHKHLNIWTEESASEWHLCLFSFFSAQNLYLYGCLCLYVHIRVH